MPDENADRGAKNTLTSSPPGKASKSLQFADTACTSTIHKDLDVLGTPIPADKMPLGSCLSPIKSHPFGLVLHTFPNAQLNGSSPLRMLTLTPISGHGCRDTSQVTVSCVFKYPSKNVNKTLSSPYQSVGKALAYGIPLQIAGKTELSTTLTTCYTKGVEDCIKRSYWLVLKIQPFDVEEN